MAHPQSHESPDPDRRVIAPADDASDAIVDAVSSGARVTAGSQVEPPHPLPPAMSLPAAPPGPWTRVSALRRSAPLVLAFVSGLGLAIWSLRGFEFSRPPAVTPAPVAVEEAAPASSPSAAPLTTRALAPLAAFATPVREHIPTRDAVPDVTRNVPDAREKTAAVVAARAEAPRTPNATPTAAAAPGHAPPVSNPPRAVEAAPAPLIATTAPPATTTVEAPAARSEREAVAARLEALETEAVRETVEDYAGALERLDVDAAAILWPTVDRRALARAFSSLKSQEVVFDECDVDLAATIATARCVGTTQYIAKVGHSGTRIGRFAWLFQMRKHNDAWKIEAVTASEAGGTRDQQ